jgi:hypothetical protein
VALAETVRLVQQSADAEFCLVQSVPGGVYGFVPKCCLADVDAFLNEIILLEAEFDVDNIYFV